MTDHSDATNLLYAALAEPIGLLLATNDPERARAKLYAARKAALDAELDVLQIRMSPFAEGELVIVKSKLALPAPTTEVRPNDNQG